MILALSCRVTKSVTSYDSMTWTLYRKTGMTKLFRRYRLSLLSPFNDSEGRSSKTARRRTARHTLLLEYRFIPFHKFY